MITTPYYDSSAYGVLCVSTRTARSDLPSQRASKPYVSWFIDQVNQKVSLFCSLRPLNSTNCNSPVSQSIRFSDWSVSSEAGQKYKISDIFDPLFCWRHNNECQLWEDQFSAWW